MADTPLTEEEQQSRRAAVAGIMPTTPYLKGLGIVMEVFEPDHARIRLPFREDLTNDGSVYHGGVIAAVLDVAAGFSVYLAVNKERMVKPDVSRFPEIGTIDLRVDYLRPGRGKYFVATGRVVRLGARVAVAHTEMENDAGELIATGGAAYMVG